MLGHNPTITNTIDEVHKIDEGGFTKRTLVNEIDDSEFNVRNTRIKPKKTRVL